MTRASAATEIGLLVNHILALAPDAGLDVQIHIEPRQHLPREGADGDGFEVSGFTHFGSVSK